MLLTFTNAHHTRLIQSAVSTRTLEGILSVLFLCAVFIYTTLWHSTSGTHRIVPHELNSIVAMATLLVVPKTLAEKVIPPDAELLGEQRTESTGIVEGWTSSLGWWNDLMGEGRRFGIDIGKGGEEEDSAEKAKRR